MLGYRIKQTVFMIAGLFVFFLTWKDTLVLFFNLRDIDKALMPQLVKIIWFGICVGGGELIARKTGGLDDAKHQARV